jgi:serine/threonine protein kinase
MHEHIINERYRIDKAIGRGGMAVVYKAFDLVLKRPVAVKILHQQFANNAHFIERFRREAYSAASLIHTNITTIYDTGCVNGMYYIVMEYVNGKTLKQIIDERAPLSVHEAVDIARQIAKALKQAHSRGIIHRDIKPQNILVTEEGIVKVTDFGIARAMAMPGLTQTGKILGTARYISPEQATGQQADERSDLYSLGVIMHEMLSGKPLFEGNSSVEMAEKHVKEKPPSLLDLNPAVPLHLEIIVGRLLRKEPDERYHSAGRLLDDLSMWESNEKHNLMLEESARNQEWARSQRQNSRGKHAAKSERTTRKAGKPDSAKAVQKSTPLSKQAREERGNNRKKDQEKQRTKRKKLTPFAKALGMVVTTGTVGALLGVVWFGIIAEPSGETLTQKIMKQQAALEKKRVAVEGVKVGKVEPREIADYDPLGDGEENPSQVSRIMDGNDRTAWSTNTYRTAVFSGLKEGAGIYLDFGNVQNVQEMTINATPGWSGEVRGSNDRSEWITLHTIKNADGRTPLSLDDSNYRYYLLWITELPSLDGKYRCKVFEVQTRGALQ